MLRPKPSSSTSAAIHREFAARVYTEWRLAGPNGDQFLRGHLHQHSAQEHGQFCIGCQENTGGICTKEGRRRSRVDQRSARILVTQTASSKSCRAHRRNGNGQYGSPSLMVLCRRGHSCLSPFGVDHVVNRSVSDKLTLSQCTNFRVSPQPRTPQRSQCVSRNGLPYRCLSFEDRSSSDKTLPRYSVRAFLYSAMIRRFSLGPASA